MNSEEPSAILDKVEARKILDKWVVLRDLRIQNEVNTWNHFLPYSADVYLHYCKILRNLKNNALGSAIQKLETLQKWGNDWLKNEWLCLGRMHQIESIFSRREWNLIQSTFKAKANNLVEILNDLKEQSEATHRSFLEKILKAVIFFKEDNKTLQKVFKEEIKQLKKLVKYHLSEMGELTAKSLFGRICVGIPLYGELKEKKGKQPKDTKPILKDLWMSLKEGDSKNGVGHARKLKNFGEKNTIYYTQLISDLQYKRTNMSDEGEKLDLLIKENTFTTEMRKNGLYYSIGLYFQNALEFDRIAKKEYKKAKELPFEAPDETPEVSIKELLDRPDNYDGINVKVSGLVANINESKQKSGRGEVVFITFELLQEENSIELYFPRNWLTDNGLKEEEFGEFTGTFNKECPKSKRSDIHLIRQGFGKRKNNDWISRCKWLVREWWDGYTGRAIANWTLGTLTPASDFFEGKQPTEKEIKNYRELRKKYPSIKGGLRAIRSLMANRVRRKIDSKSVSSLYFLYVKHSVLDSILYLTLMSILKEKITLNFSSVRWSTPESPLTDVDNLRASLFCKIEKQELEPGETLAWLNHEIDSFSKVKKWGDIR